MKFTEQDLEQSKNLIIALKKANFANIQGMEVLAFSQLYKWVNTLHETIKAEVENKVIATQQKVIDVPQPKTITKPKKSKK